MKGLIAYSDSTSMMALCKALEETDVDLELCSSLSDLRAGLEHAHVDIIFCQTRLPDGTYRNLLQFLDSANKTPAVIVCADIYDKRTYLDAMSMGAFDYVAFPFRKSEVDWIVGNVAHRLIRPGGKTQARTAPASREPAHSSA